MPVLLPQLAKSGRWTAETGLEHVQERVGFPDAAALLNADDRAEIEERAAIMELDGGLDRDRAERAAFSDLLRRQHKPRSD